MRRRALIATLLLASSVLAADAHAAAQRSRACEAQPGRTAEANDVARVYRRRGTLYACAHRGRRPFNVGPLSNPLCGTSSSGCDYMGSYELGGRYLAYSWVNSERTTRTSYLYLVDLRRVRERLIWEEGGPNSARSDALVLDLRVTRRGSVAWIAGLANYLAPTDYEVRKHDSAGAGVLDAGTDIEPGSLTIAGSRVYWMRAGSPFTATLAD